MTKTIEIKISTSDGANVTAYMGAKNEKKFLKKINKMSKRGCIELGSVLVDASEIIDMQCRVMEVN